MKILEYKSFKKSAQGEQKGFTLVEMVIYIGAAMIVLGSITGLIFLLISSRAKSWAVAEVEQQGAFAMNNITQAIRNAKSINLPGQATSGSTLNLNVIEVGDDPTIFNLASGKIQIKEGLATTIDLTSDQVVASDLNFQNLSRNTTLGIIRINFTLASNSGDKGAYKYSKNFYGSASLR